MLRPYKGERSGAGYPQKGKGQNCVSRNLPYKQDTRSEAFCKRYFCLRHGPQTAGRIPSLLNEVVLGDGQSREICLSNAAILGEESPKTIMPQGLNSRRTCVRPLDAATVAAHGL